MAEEENEEELEEKKPKKGKKSILKLIIMFFCVVVLGGAGFAGWTYYKTNFSGSKKADSEQIVQEPGLWAMDSLVVNLMDANGERYLKIVIQIEVSSQDCISEMDLLKPKITDSILDLLSSKKYKEIAGFEGKQRLRDEIAMRLNNYLTKGQVRRVYFTEFLIQ
ncbi:MAG: flagellar basal body-associated FliL family protein [Desulfobacterales bacterium]|nr:flagellar basal body-associated FliL family protein [Desulfobacterales bacterium]MBU8910553.1 flagellar basal body-associated FliL family protein [Desulfobacterales bacterium]